MPTGLPLGGRGGLLFRPRGRRRPPGRGIRAWGAGAATPRRPRTRAGGASPADPGQAPPQRHLWRSRQSQSTNARPRRWCGAGTPGRHSVTAARRPGTRGRDRRSHRTQYSALSRKRPTGFNNPDGQAGSPPPQCPPNLMGNRGRSNRNQPTRDRAGGAALGRRDATASRRIRRPGTRGQGPGERPGQRRESGTETGSGTGGSKQRQVPWQPNDSRFTTHDSRLPTPDSRLPTPDSRLPPPDSRLPIPASRLPTPGSRLPIHDSRFPTPDSRLPTPDSRLPTPDSRLPIPDSRLPMTPSRPPGTQPLKPSTPQSSPPRFFGSSGASFRSSNRWRMARRGCVHSIRGPAKRMTSRIFSLGSGR